MATKKKSNLDTAKTAAPAGGSIRIVCRGDIMKPVNEIVPYARNAKIHSEDQLSRLRASLREFGFVRPLLIDAAGNLIAGHGTLAAAVAEGMTEVPCNLAEGLTDAQRRAYILADNKLAEAPWDEAMVALELEDLQNIGFDLNLTGFDSDKLQVEQPEDAEAKPSGVKLTASYTCPNCGFTFTPGKEE